MEHLKSIEKELIRTMQSNNGLLSLENGDSETPETNAALSHLVECGRIEQVSLPPEVVSYRLLPSEFEVKQLYHDKEVLFNLHGEEMAGRIIDICAKTARVLYYNAEGKAEVSLIPFDKIL